MTPDEVRLLDNKYVLLFIRGEKPIIDLKYDILKHPNVKYTTDGNEKPYLHGGIDNSKGTIILDYNVDDFEIKEIDKIKEKYILMSEEDVEEYVKEVFKDEE